MTSDEFRRLALDVPDAVEQVHMNHPDFRVGGKVFASLGYPDEDWAMVKLTPEQQQTFLENAPAVFRPCSGDWGRKGCTNVHLASAKPTQLRPVLDAAAKNVARPAKKIPSVELPGHRNTRFS